MFTEEIINGTLRALGFVGKEVGKVAVKAILSDPPKDPPKQETLPPVVEQLKVKTNNAQANKPHEKVHGFIFGEQNGTIITKDETMDGHIMVVGGAGSGKSSCIAIPSLLAWNKRVFAIDIKGELYRKTKHKRPNIRLFNPLDNNTLGYDPFYLLKRTDNQVQEAQAISNALVPLPQDTQDPFWIQSARDLFTGAILHFFNLGYSFIDTVSKILDTPTDELVDEIRADKTTKAARFVNSFADSKLSQLSSILSTLSTHIRLFATNDSIMNCLSKKENITPDDLEHGKDIYIHVPEYLLEQWENLLALMVSQFLTHFEKRQDMRGTPILFLLDEFARLGKMEKIVKGMETLRSKNITICIILQSFSQLDYIYGEKAREVISDNCHYQAILNVNDVKAQEYFSKRVGTFDKYKVSKSQQFERFTGFSAGSSVYTTTEEKPRIKPEEFSTLNHIVLLTPFGAFKIDKAPYYDNPLYKGEMKAAANLWNDVRGLYNERKIYFSEINNLPPEQKEARRNEVHKILITKTKSICKKYGADVQTVKEIFQKIQAADVQSRNKT